MGKQLGLLKIIVMQGKRLVIQDFKTSDPYVVLKLGNQVNKTYLYVNTNLLESVLLSLVIPRVYIVNQCAILFASCFCVFFFCH